MRKRRIFVLLTATIMLAVAGNLSAQTVTFDSLLGEMVDRSTLADFPSPDYTCKQASSYDQRSVAADKPGWFANNDTSQFICSEKNGDREEWVMMDAKGPGAITRWWVTSGWFIGTVRVYIDGATEPVIETTIGDLVGGKALAGPPLSEERARGRNLYVPIPYAKSCKVTFAKNFQKTRDPKDLLYYQINYRTYAAGSKVESFTKSTIADSKAKIDEVQKQLLDPATAMPKTISKTFQNTDVVCEPGKSVSLPKLEGPGAICKISMKLDAKNLAQATRSFVLKATFDGEQTIWCPVSDFFGCGVGVNPYKGWYRQVEEDGTMTCWWIMPYEKSCVISAENLGKEPITISGMMQTCPWTWTDRSMHFHATWHQQRDIKTERNGKAAFDWNYLTVEGKGVFVGDSLALVNRQRAWWGEGDEKIYVDGEKFPSHFGTGTEDYYGYAWCTPKFFESPFHSQPRAEGPQNYGNVTNTRVRLLDDIPFTKSYKMDMEVWHWAKTTVDYAATTYWYGRPGAKANHAPQPEEATQPVVYNMPFMLPGFDIEAQPRRTKLSIQNVRNFGNGWENGDQLWWTQGKPGQKITLNIPAKSAGKHDLVLRLTKAPDYAIVQFYLDGKKVGKPVDLYSTKVEPTGPMTLGTFDLKKGKHKLTIEIVGANEKVVKSYMVGIDTVELQEK